jgi:hypothetical protein
MYNFCQYLIIKILIQWKLSKTESHGTNKKFRFEQFSVLFYKTEKFRIIQLSFYTHISWFFS